MSRRVFDILTSAGGVAIVVALVVAGGLLTWGHSFVNSNVHTQLAQQQIYFPPKAAFDHAKAGTEITPSMVGPVSQFAGQQLLTGEQAKVYANDFIAVGAIASFVLAAVLAVLVGLGFWHARRGSAEEQILVTKRTAVPASS